MHKIPTYRWPPTRRLLAARFSADLEQLQNWDFATWNRSKPIWVWTSTKSLYMLYRLSIGYHLPDFQLIWSNFKIDIFQLQTALNPYEFWRAQNARVAMTANPYATCFPIFSRFGVICSSSVISRNSRKSRKKLDIFQLQIAVNPQEFWRARNAHVAMTAYPRATCCPIFSRIWGKLNDSHRFGPLHNKIWRGRRSCARFSKFKLL